MTLRNPLDGNRTVVIRRADTGEEVTYKLKDLWANGLLIVNGRLVCDTCLGNCGQCGLTGLLGCDVPAQMGAIATSHITGKKVGDPEWDDMFTRIEGQADAQKPIDPDKRPWWMFWARYRG